MNTIARTTTSLLAIAAVAAAALGCVNSATAGKIEERAIETKNNAMRDVLSAADSFEEEVAVGQGVITSYSEGKSGSDTAGYAFAVETRGFDAGLKLMVGIDNEGVIKGVTVLSSNETPGLGARAEEVLSPQFKDKSGELALSKNGGEIEAITGATITSNAVTNAVNEVRSYYENNLKGGKG